MKVYVSMVVDIFRTGLKGVTFGPDLANIFLDEVSTLKFFLAQIFFE